jgi:serine/threonine protein kinase
MAGATEQRNTSASSLIGKTIGRYTIKATIGSGGMGHVYKATQAPINREVAIKVLRVDLAGQEGVAERFKREARAAMLIQHPNAITIYDFDETDGLLYLAMELLSGETLRQRLRREPPLTPEQGLDIFEAMAGALGVAHRVGVVHRDLKPDNIFLAKFDTVGEVVKVLDFGLAKLLDRAATGEEQLTDHNLRLGTPRYMAPEQVRGIQPIDSRCDVYALGLLLFEMLAGRAPFVGEDGMEVLAQRLRKEAPKLSQVAPQKNFSEQMDDLLARMLQRDREKRPADANEVLTQVRELRKNNEVYRPNDGVETMMAPQEQVPRGSRPSLNGRSIPPTGRSRPGTDPGASRPANRPVDAMMRLDQDDDMDKRTVLVDQGYQGPDPAAANLDALTQAAGGPQSLVPQASPMYLRPLGGSIPPQAPPSLMNSRPPSLSATPALAMSSVTVDTGGDPTGAPSSSAMARQTGRGMKLAVALVVALAVLAPLVALLLKYMSSRGDDHVEPAATPDVTSVPQPPKADSPAGEDDKPGDKDKPGAAANSPTGGDKGKPAKGGGTKGKTGDKAGGDKGKPKAASSSSPTDGAPHARRRVPLTAAAPRPAPQARCGRRAAAGAASPRPGPRR